MKKVEPTNKKIKRWNARMQECTKSSQKVKEKKREKFEKQKNRQVAQNFCDKCHTQYILQEVELVNPLYFANQKLLLKRLEKKFF